VESICSWGEGEIVVYGGEVHNLYISPNFNKIPISRTVPIIVAARSKA
jgi:hypothetical protein